MAYYKYMYKNEVVIRFHQLAGNIKTSSSLLQEKRRIAITNAARQWEVARGTAMAKTIHLQPHHQYEYGEGGGRKNGWDSLDVGDSRPE